jgi:multidrug resistance efflux pump
MYSSSFDVSPFPSCIEELQVQMQECRAKETKKLKIESERQRTLHQQHEQRQEECDRLKTTVAALKQRQEQVRSGVLGSDSIIAASL